MSKAAAISAKETYAIRQPVLREGLQLSSCIFEGDDLPTTVHYGIYENNSIAGVISLYQIVNKLFTEKQQMQIRGMAVLPKYQKKG